MATNITNTMLTGLRQHIVDMAAYGEYLVGGSWIRAEVNSKAVQQNGAVYVTFYARRQAGVTDPITQFRIKNAAGQVLASRTETLNFVTGIDAILYRFKFGVTIDQGE